MNFATLWEREVGDTVLKVSFLRDQSGVVVASERVVRMFDFEGEKLWRYALESAFRDLAPLPEGRCVVACRDGLIFLRLEGNVEKETRLDKEPKAVAANGKTGFLANSELHILDPGDDSVVRAVLDFEPEFLACNDYGFIVADRDSIESLGTTGGSRWKKVLDTPASSTVAEGPSIYLIVGDGVQKLDSKGEEAWKEDFQSPVKQIDIGESLLVVLENEAVILDNKSRDRLWKVKGEFVLGSVCKDAFALVKEKTVIFMKEMGDEEVFYEIMCRGSEKCGSFVSSRFLRRCPKCGAEKIILRIVKKKLTAGGDKEVRDAR